MTDEAKHSDLVYHDRETDERYPLFEADYDWSFTVYKTDAKKAVRNDPYRCIEAIAACKLPNVKRAFIGSSHDAHLIFGPTPSRPFDHVVHYIIPSKSKKVRDLFDQKGGPTTQVLPLKAPTRGRTLKARRASNARRRAEIKAGTGKPVVSRNKKNRPRIVRLGVPRRPAAKIEAV